MSEWASTRLFGIHSSSEQPPKDGRLSHNPEPHRGEKYRRQEYPPTPNQPFKIYVLYFDLFVRHINDRYIRKC